MKILKLKPGPKIGAILDVLLAEVAGAVAAPMSTLAGLFDAPLRDIAWLVGALAENRAA